MQDDPVQGVLTPPFKEAIGHVAEQFSLLEDFMNQAIFGLLKTSQKTGRAVTSRLQFNTRADMLQALALEVLQDEGSKRQIVGLIRKIKPLAEERNNLMHAIWGGPLENGKMLRIKYTGYGEVKFVKKEMSAEDIQRVASGISHTTAELYGFILKHGLFTGEITPPASTIGK